MSKLPKEEEMLIDIKKPSDKEKSKDTITIPNGAGSPSAKLSKNP